MQILLANAKIMFGKTNRKPISTPLFQTVADILAAEMARIDVDDLARQLDCSYKIAAENWQRYQNFMAPAVDAEEKAFIRAMKRKKKKKRKGLGL